ncbi:glycerol kinase GlpK [Pseudochrobactrum sp. sp1633]|uniref:glycerol kinase GlpK n=1 Tax=Pseudochrobactrum sp. sp1633 TaxID=3036706 RepID=UPI0025A63DB7|nr:glycerol kinase GlpK [Pseudochrobactrum sp. sp1633]MDM8344268.1 glycerol kinase GlpK [Pseudochrobactrum sp. sp1633]HWD14599.1 glycerol kinase GlpK [Pseudochrobactrum sp.]
MSKLILAIDQGTTSSRAICFDQNHKIAGLGQKEFTQHYPKSGWVEHDPEEIWQSVVTTCKQAVENAKASMADVAAIGITNQRETVVVWDKATGKPVYNAIVWQDRRTQKDCLKLKKQGLEPRIRRKTGLLLDPYFSATKLAWILNKVSGARKKAEKGELLFGTIDCFLIWRLTGGKVHATDATNASRTLLFNIADNGWDDELLKLFNIPRAMLPEVKDCADDFGTTEARILGAEIPILGVAGDQHAAMIGQACFEKGMLKATFGTGCFALLNTGKDKVLSRNRLLTTIAYRLNGEITYALEGSIFVAGAAVQWLRDGLKIIKSAAETGELARQADETQDVYLVPAFVGLGAPHWDAEARGAIYGLTRNSGPAEISKAALESVAYQAHDLLEAMHKDWKTDASDIVLRVDGGMVASDWTMQNLADILDAPVDRPAILETTALGAAWLAGMKAGLWGNMQSFAKDWEQQQRFEPVMEPSLRKRKITGWRKSVRSTLRAK